VGRGDRAGESVALALSDSLVTVAIGFPLYDANEVSERENGLVRVFSYIPRFSTDWVQLGPEIQGDNPGDQTGYGCALSADGTILAVLSSQKEPNPGYVRIYSRNISPEGFSWDPMGQTLIGGAGGQKDSVSLSSDGTIVAIGSPRDNAVGIYAFNGTSDTWEPMGAQLTGEVSGDLFGFSVRLSSDGNTLAVGAPRNRGGKESNTGQVKVYRYSESSLSWSQMGQSLVGTRGRDLFGRSVDLSSDGETLAVSATGNSDIATDAGEVKIYTFMSDLSEWVQRGNTINGESPGDLAGKGLALSGDGRTVAVGSPGNAGGLVRVFVFSDLPAQWNQLGATMHGEGEGSHSGSDVAMSSDGRMVAIGSPFFNGNATRTLNSGRVCVHEWELE